VGEARPLAGRAKRNENAVLKRYLNYSIFQRFSNRILLLGVVAGILPLGSILVIFSLFSHGLVNDLHQSLADLKAREGQRLKSHQDEIVNQLVRQKALDVAQTITTYLNSHPGQSWEKTCRDPVLREMVVQPGRTLGATFVVTAGEKRILLHQEPAHEGQTLKEALIGPGKMASAADLSLTSMPGLEEFSLVHGQEALGRGFLAPVPITPGQGPAVMAGVWVDPRKMALITAQSREILKTTLNQTEALIETRLGEFRNRLFAILAVLGLVALGASLALARRVTTQVSALTKAAEAFDQGNLSYRLLKPGQDELGQLARTMNRMAASLNDTTISRMEWENTFNVLPDPVIVVDADARLTRLNRAAALYLDAFPEEAVGCHVSELKGPGHDWFPRQALTQVLQQGKKTRTDTATHNGHTYLVTVDPCWDLKGEISGAVFVARDITALKQMQEELARASHFLGQLVESAPLGLTFIDPQGLIIQANPQFLQEFGYNPEDVLHRHYSFLYAREEEHQQVLAELRDKGEILGRQVQLQHRLGHSLPARISIRKLLDKDGRVIGSVSLASNISEEVSLQRQLEQAQKQEVIATLAGGLAHNFNNLLMIIMGLTSLMVAKISPEHPAHADLKDIEGQVRAGREITRKLLAFRRVSDFETQPIHLNNLVEATADMFGRTRQELIIQKRLSPKLPAVEVDSGQIQQVLMNLFINAWQAMSHGGSISLETRAVQLTDWHDQDWDLEPGPYVILSVTDSGMGMTEDTVSNLFKPFFTTKEPGQGSGLGLATAYRIMKNHRGAIQVTSKPGEGATFTLFFPASAALPLDTAPEEKQIIQGQGTILVVEDEPTLRRVAGKLLEKLGYRVLEATCGEGALEIFADRSGDIDLVILDVIMPGLNGMETLARLRDMDPNVRVILCSGLEETPERNLPAGVSFLCKPVPLELLSQKVAAALGA
jgi:two-component system, cell cycle sensor histidine kinase and response regulator CckA